MYNIGSHAPISTGNMATDQKFVLASTFGILKFRLASLFALKI